ncbi:hypothetical protein SOCE26_065340 [Sorangium cellulosum]|uniref:Secreted protein n=1 Tax=Sorangium cellulosum TaxID=56 RepID=A0A2L0F0K0_SORCE|nr:hypothetical protein [Sorangium cellulosum]AUX45053.1 hypothetical protein SOCE26_065340 [Sorangium cellulosum]
MRRRTLRFSAAGVFRLAALAAAGAVAGSCHEPLDTARQAPPKATLGDDVFGVLCDRVGASSLYEDHLGASYQRVCHYYEGEGGFRYDDKVDVSLLPPVAGERAEQARRLGVAKIEAMARWRSDLVRAVNAAVPDIEIENVAAGEGGGTIRLHDAFLDLSHALAPLYETNPFDPEGPAVVPASTRALGRLTEALGGSEEVTGKLAQIGERRGYRPANVALGAARAALEYPDLRAMTRASLEVLGPGGAGAPAFQALLAAGKGELRALDPEASREAPLVVAQATAQPSRPRTLIELAGAVALAEDPRFAASDSSPPRLVVRRDRRGFAIVAGGVPAPFADEDGDSLADVDTFGRFVGTSGAPVEVDPPFAIPGVTALAEGVDPFAPLSPDVYEYIDTSRTLAAAALRSVVPLVDATRYVGEGDPEPWKTEHEGLMYTLAGAYLLYGDREEATYDFARGAVEPPGATCAGCLPYRRFRGEDSPLADLAHALGQVLADRESDVLLSTLIDLLENHEADLARMMGATLRIRDIAREHDRLAAEGKEARAQIADEAPLWDELAAVLGRVVDQPGLVTRLLEAFDAEALLTPRGGSRHLGDAIATIATTRDQLAYNPEDLNGPAINLTVGAPSTADPRTPVDQKKPKIGDNRSAMERLMHLIHDTAGVRQCNKPDAELNAFGVTIPLLTYDECELFQIDNLAAFYLDSLLPEGHDKRAELDVKPTAIGLLVTDGVLEDSSGITGLTSHPTPSALSRLIYFGADSERFSGDLLDLDPLRELTNERTNDFISGSLEPAGTNLCPKNGNGVNVCTSPEGLIRVRHPGTTFLIERLGLGVYLGPLVEPFADVAPDDTGEELLIDLLSTFYRHWPGKEHGPECSKSGTPQTNPAYCSEAGGNTYEPLLADALQADDVMESTVAFSQMLADTSAKIPVQRGPGAGQVAWTKAQVIEKLARIFFSTRYATSVGLVDRWGKKSATWADGRTQDQLTVFTLLADALNRIDARFAQSAAPDAAARKGQWDRATGELVDAFLAVEGEGAQTRFKNRAIPTIGAAVLRVLREQLNAHCPDRESTGRCPWARKELGAKVADLVSHPLFAGFVDVAESVRAHEPARREIEKFITYLLDADAEGEAFQALLATVIDGVQVLADDATLAPILKAGAVALSPAGDPDGPGAADTGLNVLKALGEDRFDRYHAMDHVLPGLVAPMADGRAPIQVFLEAIADVNRVDAASAEPLSAEDYRQVLHSTRGFLLDETRGLEQIYAILAKRPHE